MAKMTTQQNTICSGDSLLKETIFKDVCKKQALLDDARIEMVASVMALNKELEAGKAEHLKRYNLSEGRLSVLMALWHAERPLKATEIADSLKVTRATMTGLVDSLVEDGFVDKKDSEVDRRIHSLALTKKGTNFIKEIIPDHFNRIRQFAEILTKEEAKTLTSIIYKLLKGIKCFKED